MPQQQCFGSGAGGDGRPKIALLIDAENNSHEVIPLIMKELEAYGSVACRRAYGNFTLPSLKKWPKVLEACAIQPVLQMTSGKNSSDAAFIIDAMDMLHSGRYDAFALATSDGDFSRLATRLKDDCKIVVGIGSKKITAKALVSACTSFVFVETLMAMESKKLGRKKKPAVLSVAETEVMEEKFHAAVIESGASGEDGWAPLSRIRELVRKRDPSFDYRALGFSSSMKLVSAHVDKYEIWRSDNNKSEIWVRSHGSGAAARKKRKRDTDAAEGQSTHKKAKGKKAKAKKKAKKFKSRRG